jgi:hypothetical protein
MVGFGSGKIPEIRGLPLTVEECPDNIRGGINIPPYRKEANTPIK